MDFNTSVTLAFIVATAIIIGMSENKKKAPDKGTGCAALVLSALIIVLGIVAAFYFMGGK